MKRELLALIKEIPTIEGKFRIFEPSAGMCIPSGEFIYDNPDFIEWKEAVEYELQQIYDRTMDTYIWNIINDTGVIHKFNGKNYDERENFNRLKSSLKVIEKNIDKYFPDYGIPLNQDIYEYLSSLFSENELYVIFVLSSNYYGSPACLNEMGAAWVLKNEYTSILLPKFEYQEIDGAVNPNKIGMKLDDDDELLKKRLGELKDIISEKFSISVSDMRWEKKRNDFINTIRNI